MRHKKQDCFYISDEDHIGKKLTKKATIYYNKKP